MKKFLILCVALFATTAIAHTIDWYVDGQVYQTTSCESGDSVTPPTPPAKYGYTFQEWYPLYKQLEYIESTGTQYIDFTNAAPIMTPIGKITSVAKIALTQNTRGRQFLFSIGSGSVAHYVEVNDNGNFSLGGGTSGEAIHCNTEQVYEIEHTINGGNSSTLAIYGVQRLSISVYQSSTNISPRTLFKIDSFITPYVRLYQYKLYVDDILKFYFIPVLDQSGTPCMYDKVSKTFFYNSGTGDFIAGPAL